METKNIDRTHIIALKEENGILLNMELPISRPEQFIDELNAMVENPNRTMWDMQSYFAQRFPKNAMYLDYIHPHSYRDSYVGVTPYPNFSDYDELRQTWAKAGRDAREAYINNCKHCWNRNPDNEEAVQREKEAVDNLKKSQKYNFLQAAMRWINASCYTAEANRLNNDRSVKMFSKENVGWNDFIHQVNDDIKVAIKTNFGFGSAAHFILAIQYKGLDILPYSHIVRYYKAGMADIVRCTRSYLPCRESWSASFDFLSDFVNRSVADPENFVRTYIMNEVEEMMSGLEKIAVDPIGFLNRIANNKVDPYIINVRQILREEKVKMSVYPEETEILFKVEKIMGALYFLNSLTEIAKEVKDIQKQIDRLLELNMALCPEVRQAADKVKSKIETQSLIKEKLDSQIATLSEKLHPYEEEIQKLFSMSTQENPFRMEDYEPRHPEYSTLKKEKQDIQSQLYKVKNQISDFESFLSILNRSIQRLDEVKQLKEAA